MSSIQLYPSVVVGLGGTGRTACGTLKRLMRERTGRSETPKHIRLLSIDSHRREDAAASAMDPLDPTKEKFLLELKNPADVISNLETYAPWFPKDWALRSRIREVNETGAGAERPIGRLLVEFNWSELLAKLKNAAQEVQTNILGFQQNTDVRREFDAMGFGNFEPMSTGILFILIGNLVSGTGSGGFLELAYILRSCLRLEKNRYCAFLSLPPATDVDLKHLRNSAAALRELQHFMSPEVYYDPGSAYQISAAGARTTLIPYKGLTQQAPFDLVGLARPPAADKESVRTLDIRTAEFIYDLTCTPLGPAFFQDLVNLPSFTTPEGNDAVFVSYGSFKRDDPAVQAAGKAHLMLADFIADDLSGISNPGEEARHLGWKEHDLEGVINRLRTSWGLPSKNDLPSAAFTQESQLRTLCRPLLDLVKRHAMESGFAVGAKTLNILDPEVIRNEVLSDGVLRAHLNDPALLGKTLEARLPEQLSGLANAFEAALPGLMSQMLSDFILELDSLFARGASVEQMLRVCRQLQRDSSDLASLIGGLDPQLKVGFGTAPLKAIVDSFLKRVREWAATGLADFQNQISDQIRLFIEKRAAYAAIRLVRGWGDLAGNPIRRRLGGVEFALDLGLRGCLQELESQLEKAKASLVAASNMLEREGDLRIAREAAVVESLQRMYTSGVSAYFRDQRNHRDQLLLDVGATKILTLVEARALQEGLIRRARVLTDSVTSGKFSDWWASYGRIFDRESLENLLSVPLNGALAQAAGGELEIVITEASPAEENEPPRNQLKELSGHYLHLPSTRDNSVSLIAAKGRAVLSWIADFQYLSNSYGSVRDSLEALHTIKEPYRLKPITFSSADQLMAYVTGLALDWIAVEGSDCYYKHTVGGFAIGEPRKLRYNSSPDPEHPRGPTGGLFAAIPADQQLMLPGSNRSARTVYEHLRAQAEEIFREDNLQPQEQERRIANLHKLLLVYVKDLKTKQEERPMLLREGDINVAGEQVDRWLRSWLDYRKDLGRLEAEVVEEYKRNPKLPELIKKYRALAMGGSWTGDGGRDGATETGAAKTALMEHLKSVGLKLLDSARIADAASAGLAPMIEAAQACGLTEEQIEQLVEVAGSHS